LDNRAEAKQLRSQIDHLEISAGSASDDRKQSLERQIGEKKERLARLTGERPVGTIGAPLAA
jgi:hypothetical protein